MDKLISFATFKQAQEIARIRIKYNAEHPKTTKICGACQYYFVPNNKNFGECIIKIQKQLNLLTKGCLSWRGVVDG